MADESELVKAVGLDRAVAGVMPLIVREYP